MPSAVLINPFINPSINPGPSGLLVQAPKTSAPLACTWIREGKHRSSLLMGEQLGNRGLAEGLDVHQGLFPFGPNGLVGLEANMGGRYHIRVGQQ